MSASRPNNQLNRDVASWLMDCKTSAIVDEVLQVNARHEWDTPDGAVNQCQMASRQLATCLRDGGIEAEVLWLMGPRGDPLGRHRSADDVHMTVLTGGEVIDLTRRQWDPNGDHPTVYPTLVAAAVHWTAHYQPGDEHRESEPTLFDSTDREFAAND